MSDKPKNDLLSALNHIERYHQRRSIFIGHLLLSLALQFIVWANWFASYALQNRGFEGTFFTDRLSISVVLVFLLIGHFAVMRLMEKRDRLVVRAIEQHHDGAERGEPAWERLSDVNQSGYDDLILDEQVTTHRRR